MQKLTKELRDKIRTALDSSKCPDSMTEDLCNDLHRICNCAACWLRHFEQEVGKDQPQHDSSCEECTVTADMVERIAALGENRDTLARALSDANCLFTGGPLAESGGSHCPIDNPCYRCRAERAEERIVEFQDEALRSEVELVNFRARVVKLENSANFYRKRCTLLERCQRNMRDPERQIVCDILANGALLPDPEGTRYGSGSTLKED